MSPLPPKRRAEAPTDRLGEFSELQEPSKAQAMGRWGESLVQSTLEKHGFELVGRNFRISGIELDLILVREGRILVVEVKTRQWPSYPEECFRDWQRGRIHRALPPLSRALNHPLERMDLLLASVRLRPGHEPEICFFRIPMEPRAP
jgi:Uncharacterised protein family UPF0102